MIALSPGSLCDVCAEEYGPHNYPHSIPCGHILCLNCCNNIIEKTSPRLTPCCPFCREVFTSEGIRLIRVDFTPTSSGWSTPRVAGFGVHDVLVESDVEDSLSSGLRAREQAKRLEYKVARVAAKKCSVEEVTKLHKELQDWLSSKFKPREQTSSLELSAALLRAILMNHLADSEARAHLNQKIEDMEMSKTKLEGELRSLRTEYSQTAQECQSLRAELNRVKLKSVAPSLGVPSTPPSKSFASLQNGALLSPPRPQSTTTSSTSDPRSRATSPTSPTPYSHANVHSPLASRVGMLSNTSHARSASAQLPATALRSHTPATAPRSHTPAARTGTPASPGRPELKTRRMSVSTPSPLKMARSTSSGSTSDVILIQKERDSEREKDRDVKRVQLIQRWMPNLESASPPTGRFNSYFHNPSPPTTIPRSRTISAASAALHPPLRHKTPLSANSP